MTDNGYCSPAEAARIIGVARQTIYVYLEAKKLRAIRPRGTHWRVNIEDAHAMARGDIDVSGIWSAWRKKDAEL